MITLNLNRKLWIVIYILYGTAIGNDCDTIGSFYLKGMIRINTVAGPNAPCVKMSFYRFDQDTTDRPKLKKDNKGKMYLEFPEPKDTIPKYITITDSFGFFKICPFDSGVYKVKMVLVPGDSLRHAVFTRACICIPDTLIKIIPQIKFDSKRKNLGYAFINDEDPVDRISCCEEFKNRIYNIECCKECSKCARNHLKRDQKLGDR
jgi:hypothetical protein